jgi:hypothetical protein
VCYQSHGRTNIILSRKCGITTIQPRGAPAAKRMLKFVLRLRLRWRSMLRSLFSDSA